MPSSCGRPMPASASARSTTEPIALTWARLASSGTTPPKIRCTSWDRITWPATDPTPPSARITAAEVSSQDVSMPRIQPATLLLGLFQQPLDGGDVGRRAPVVGADHPLDQLAPAVEQEALGHTGGLIEPLDRAAPVVQDVEAEVQLAGEGGDVLGAALVDADRGDPEAPGADRVEEPLHGRHLLAAGYAPGGPDVHQRHGSPVILQRDRVAGGEVDGLEVRRLAVDLHAAFGRHPGERRRAQGESRHHDAGHGPLSRHRMPQARTAQRRWRSRTAWAGSSAPNTAVPATNVSAPASHASVMVSVVMPPSTSRVARDPAWSSRARTRRILSVAAGR